jgi:hypothetical protein
MTLESIRVILVFSSANDDFVIDLLLSTSI